MPTLWQRACERGKTFALLLGLVAAAGYPPVHLWWVSLLALAAFVALVHQAKSWRIAALLGWLFGWSHLTLANNWIATAFTHQAKMPEFLGWIAVPLLCVYLALYPALAALSAHVLSRRLNGAGAALASFGLIFTGTWILFEWVRSWAFTGYPWPPLGLLFLGGWDTPGAALLLPWLGTYALSGLVLFTAALIAVACRSRYSWIALLPIGLVAVLMHVVGATAPRDSDIAYTLVQPYLPQEEINDGSKFEEQFARIADLTVPGRDTSRLVLWPESAIPDYLEDGYPQRYYNRMTALNPLTLRGDPEFARQRIGGVIGPQSTLLTGVVNLNIGQSEGRLQAVSARNSVIALNGEGEIEHSYAKAHLVPYGEYLPMRGLLEPLGFSRLVAGSIDYQSGAGPRTLDLGVHGKAGVQICYEIVFSGRVVDRDNRPDYLFNPSNDGWFGHWGPPQHLAQARMRALEEGLPVLRSTTTGISAVIDANGVVRDTIGMNQAAAIKGVIPMAHAPTWFSQAGNALALGWAILALILGLAGPRALALWRTRG